jgi:hypothetical protein
MVFYFNLIVTKQPRVAENAKETLVPAIITFLTILFRNNLIMLVARIVLSDVTICIRKRMSKWK